MRQGRLIIAALIALPLAFAAAVAQATVVAAAETGFTIVTEVDVTVSPAVAYRALTQGPANWWDSEHTFGGDATRLTLDPRAGGCFCEQMDGGGSVSHGTVIYADPGQMLRLSSALGPLQQMAVSGVLSFGFAPRPFGAHVTLTYRVYGGFTTDAVELSKLVDSVLGAQLQRFAAHVGRKE